MRSYKNGAYEVATIADADDVLDADGTGVLNFWQAQERVRQLYAEAQSAPLMQAGPYTVADAVAEYLDWIASRGKPTAETRQRAEAFILPSLGKLEVASLTTAMIRKWLRDLAETPPQGPDSKGGANSRGFGKSRTIQKRSEEGGQPRTGPLRC